MSLKAFPVGLSGLAFKYPAKQRGVSFSGTSQSILHSNLNQDAYEKVKQKVRELAKKHHVVVSVHTHERPDYAFPFTPYGYREISRAASARYNRKGELIEEKNVNMVEPSQTYWLLQVATIAGSNKNQHAFDADYYASLKQLFSKETIHHPEKLPAPTQDETGKFQTRFLDIAESEFEIHHPYSHFYEGEFSHNPTPEHHPAYHLTVPEFIGDKITHAWEKFKDWKNK